MLLFLVTNSCHPELDPGAVYQKRYRFRNKFGMTTPPFAPPLLVPSAMDGFFSLPCQKHQAPRMARIAAWRFGHGPNLQAEKKSRMDFFQYLAKSTKRQGWRALAPRDLGMAQICNRTKIYGWIFVRPIPLPQQFP